MSNDELVLDVNDELFWDPKIDSEEIAVSADAGKVTLRGTVGSFRQKREATKAAERVYGVKSVRNELQVRLLNDSRREDAELRGDVLQALMLDSLLPTTIDAKVDDGLVTLKGTTDWQYQRDEAEFVAGNVFGVIGVDDQIELKNPTPSAANVKDAIKQAFERNAGLDADDISVVSSNGTVTLEGEVSSWAEHDEAVAAAWAAPGVTDVKDRIYVDY
ncbi:MAG TPA: BON domain-containing protein [Gaiellaceae bacterium]|nr:BON domain-containing protein [Gaiellaceae bacterium]